MLALLMTTVHTFDMTIRPEQFASDRPPRRIIGTEMEYDADIIGHISEATRQQYITSMKISGSLNGYMTNGALWYRDMDHQEYATAESAGPLEAMHTDHAGIRFMSKLAILATTDAPLTAAQKYRLAPQRRSGTFNMNDGNPETNVNTKGYHQNFQVPAELLNDAALRSVVATHLATRQIIGGAGFQMGTRYRIGQKSYDIGHEVVMGFGNRTGKKRKPIAGVLEAEDKASPDWNVLEVRLADPSMNPYQTVLDLGSTSLVLRLIEQGIITPQNSPEYSVIEPVSAVHFISSQPLNTAKRTYQMQSDEHLTAVDIQRRFAEAVKDMLASGVRLPRDEQYVAAEWLDVVDRLSGITHDIHSLDPLYGRLDWATKCLAMHRKGLYAIQDPDEYIVKSVAFDLLWSSVAPNGIGNRYAARLGRHYDKLTAAKQDYLITPPRTRASARAALIMNDAIDTVSWNEATTFDGHGVQLGNAYSPHVPTLPVTNENE